MDLFANYLQIKKASEDKIFWGLVFTGGPTWARTRDHLIMSQVL